MTIQEDVFGSLNDEGGAHPHVDSSAISLDAVHGATVGENTLTGTGWSTRQAEIKTTPSCQAISAEAPVLLGFPSP